MNDVTWYFYCGFEMWYIIVGYLVHIQLGGLPTEVDQRVRTACRLLAACDTTCRRRISCWLISVHGAVTSSAYWKRRLAVLSVVTEVSDELQPHRYHAGHKHPDACRSAYIGCGRSPCLQVS